MECSCRFTAAEGGARLANAARTRNTLAAPPPEHAAFVATRLLHETAYMIRGSLCEGQRRSVYLTRASRVACVAYDLAILTDLNVCSAKAYEDVYDWFLEIDKKEVLVTTTEVLKTILEEEVITMSNLNLMIIESCHLVCNDDNLRYVMMRYRELIEDDRPRILALTYPLFAQDRKVEAANSGFEEIHTNGRLDDLDIEDRSLQLNDQADVKDNTKDDSHRGDALNHAVKTTRDDELDDTDKLKGDEVLANSISDQTKTDDQYENDRYDIGIYKNMDNFEMYEKLEWKLDVLEQELCCEVDLAEDIDGVKRLSASLGKPKEQIIEYNEDIDFSKLPETYSELDMYMRHTVGDVLEFLEEHRYDPTEIYGEDLYEEIKNIPNPTLDPKYIMHQFLYVLDQLGPYGADKAAFTLLTKLEKLKIKVPYERHFLLLCMCTSVFVKMRCAADLVFQKYQNEWERIRTFSTPKLLRFVEILEKFRPPLDQTETKDTSDRNDRSAKIRREDGSSKQLDADKMLKAIDACDFASLSDKLEDRVHIIEGNLKEIVDMPDDRLGVSDSNSKQNIIDKFLESIGKVQIQNGVVEKDKVQVEDKTTIEELKTEKLQPEDSVKTLGFHRRPHRVRGRGRVPRNNPSRLQNQQNPDTLCSIVFMQEPLMAKILFIIVVELSRYHPNLKFLCAQYCAIENPADPVKEPREFEKQRRKQEEVLKKFRMHECNLLLATSALEDGIDLPRCNLVLRWDLPSSYRSYGLCRNRARAPRSACVLLTRGGDVTTERLLHHVATYKELDQIVSRKCGCGIQDEPPEAEENHADTFNQLVKPYTPDKDNGGRCANAQKDIDGRVTVSEGLGDTSSHCTNAQNDVNSHVAVIKDGEDHGGRCANMQKDVDSQVIVSEDVDDNSRCCANAQNDIDSHVAFSKDVDDTSGRSANAQKDIVGHITISEDDDDNGGRCANVQKNVDGQVIVTEDVKAHLIEKSHTKNCVESIKKVIHQNDTSCCLNKMSEQLDIKQEATLDATIAAEVKDGKSYSKTDTNMNVNDGDNSNVNASVDLNSAIALINRYCGKLPSDTFTRLAPQWWMEEVQLPLKRDPTNKATAYVCTLRLPLNCPVKYNIVGHPMPSRVLARRMVALQACRILHRSGELDNQLMPIGKENFKAPEFEYAPAPSGDGAAGDAGDLARPGTTKRRQYYYKRTASVFIDCQPIIDTSDSEIDKENETRSDTGPDDASDRNGEAKEERVKSGKRNVLYAISCKLWCALPERYNTRGRRLHAPQHARQALAILMARPDDEDLQIPAFPVYTRSGEVRVSLERVSDADVRLSSARARLIRRFMRFVFAQVLRVRRRGMRLQSEGSTHNNYYIVPTVKTVREDGSTKIDIDWPFLELIYQYTEKKKNSEVEKSLYWQQEDDEDEDMNEAYDVDTDKDTGRDKSDDTDTKESQHTQNLFDERQVNVDDEEALEGGNSSAENSLNSKSENSKVEDTKSSKQIDGESKDDKNIRDIDMNDASHRDANAQDGERRKGRGEKLVKKMDNPLLAPGETFTFESEKYREAVVTPWYRNQDQPQFFLVAEICWSLSPESAFPSATHTTFRSYYSDKYGVTLTQPNQPLLDVDHTSARLNLLTPRYVNRKGVALPVSSERTRRAKRDRLDQKQILVPELCRVHPFAAPLWFSTVALPCVLYRINALLIADEIRRAVAIDVGLGIPKIDEKTCPGFEWPPLDFGWSLAEVLNVNDDKPDKKKDSEEVPEEQKRDEGERDTSREEKVEQTETEVKPKTLNDILQEKEDAESSFEIGTWSNDMASSISMPMEYDEYTEPLPPNLTFCTSASGGTNWCDPVQRPVSSFHPTRTYSVVDSDCSYMSSDFDTDDSDMNSENSDDDIDTDGLSTSKNRNAAMGVRIEYKTAHEAEAVDVKREKRAALAPQPDEADDSEDRRAQDAYLSKGDAPAQYIEKFRQAIDQHKAKIIDDGLLVKKDLAVSEILPEAAKGVQDRAPKIGTETGNDASNMDDPILAMYEEMFPYITENCPQAIIKDGNITLENIERSKRALLADLKRQLPDEEIQKLHLYSMVDVDIDSSSYVDEKLVNVGFDSKGSYVEKLNDFSHLIEGYEPCINRNKVENGKTKKDFDFDYQPKLEGHPGPSPSVILQALTMSNANDGINLERLETIGDSFLKFAITAYLYCAHPTVHEGKLSHMRSKQVSNLNLYRLGRNKRLGARMIASKFEPHDNWLPPCHRPPPTLTKPTYEPMESVRARCAAHGGAGDCYIPYNLITQHSIPDKSIADCVEALIGAYLIECGPRGALLFMSWLGIRVLPRHEVVLSPDHPYVKAFELAEKRGDTPKTEVKTEQRQRREEPSDLDSECSATDEECYDQDNPELEDGQEVEDWSWPGRAVGSLRPYRNENGQWVQAVFGELRAPPSPLLRYIADPEGELDQMLSGYEALERTLQYRFRDRSLLLQALTHASHHQNRLTDCYQRLEFLGDAILDYLITRYLYEDGRRHSPGALTDLRSALVNNTIFATLAVRHGFHKYFRHMSPGLNEVLTRYVKIQEENGHSISEEHYLIQEDELEQAEDVEVPKALGDLFESVAGAIFLDSGMSLGAVWSSYVRLMGAELEAFSAAAPKSPVRELLEAEPDTAKFGKPERLADGRRVRVCVEVFGRGTFKGVGRNYRIAKGTAARCALRHLRAQHRN